MPQGPVSLPAPGQHPTEFIREFSEATLDGQPTAQDLIRTVGKLDAIAEREIARLKATPEGKVACQPGCDHCCHKIVGAGVAEIIQIAQVIATKFSPAQRAALIARCERYANESISFRSGRELAARPTCPLLVDRRCSVYEARPVGCRGMNSRSAAACEASRKHPDTAQPIPMDPRQNGVAHALSIAHSTALHAAKLDHTYVDLGLALPDLLADMGLVSRYLAGHPILLEHAFVPPGPDGIRELRKREVGGDIEPSGFPPQPAIAGHPVYEFLRLTIPGSYASQQAIDTSLARYHELIDEFCEAPMDPAAAFDGLSEFQTFNLPYTGENVTGLLKEVGRRVVNPVVAGALPDLVEPIEPRKPEGRLKVGYLSYNMIAHNATTPMRGWLENHADDIETHLFHVGPTQDPTTLLYRVLADHAYHLPGDVPSTARFIKEIGLDILIFPDIGNYGKNYQYAAMRLAPVQCTTWGQPVTSGLSTIDYFLSSELMEPENGQDHYSEELVRLPGSGWYWMPAEDPPSTKTREQLGLPEGDFYVVGQNVRKLVPKWDHLFAEIQARTAAPMIFTDFGADSLSDPTKERLAKAGVKATWIPMQAKADFFRILQLATASLDPPAWHGGSTTVYGLMAGAPIVSLPGEFMRSRFSLALMKQANVEGLIARTPEEYVEIAANPDRIREAMKGLNAEGMLRDAAVPPALDDFLRRATGRA